MVGNDDEDVKLRKQAARFCVVFFEEKDREDAEMALLQMLRHNDRARADLEAQCGMQTAFIRRVMVLARAGYVVQSSDIKEIAQSCGIRDMERDSA